MSGAERIHFQGIKERQAGHNIRCSPKVNRRVFLLVHNFSRYPRCIMSMLTTIMKEDNRTTTAWECPLSAQMLLSVSQACPEAQLWVRRTPWGCSGMPHSQAMPHMRMIAKARGVTACWDALAWLGEMVPTTHNVALHRRAMAKGHKTD